MSVYADVAVEPARVLDRPHYTYLVPEGMEVVPGHRVLVPFGRRTAWGYVLATVSEDPGIEVRPIERADRDPLLLPHQMELARLVAGHYWAPLIECLRAMVPPRIRGGKSSGAGPSARQHRHSQLLLAASHAPVGDGRLDLNADQSAALALIRDQSAVLLHGVTESGKTEVYLAAAEAARVDGLATLVLVPEISLTPQLVQRFALARMPRRVRGVEPEIELVDMRAEAEAGNRLPLSQRLVEVVNGALEDEAQAILFLNRRGMATFVLCRDCGKSLQCPDCSVAMVQHPEIGGLSCHYCGYSRPLPPHCPYCGSRQLRALGIGTQRLESVARKLWPQARILRLDRDTAGGDEGYFEIFEAFASGRADILVGTQLVARGLDLPAVTAVGVVDADLPLHFPDYRSAENTFALVTQVAGRAGRRERQARVVVQTSNPDHYALRRAAEHDYLGFYKEELPSREVFRFPPFAELAVLTYSNEHGEKAAQTARDAADELAAGLLAEKVAGIKLLGPSPAFVFKVRGQYRWQITLKGEGLERARPFAPSGRGWSYDVDPVM